MAEELLETRLRALTASVDWPPTPDIAGAVGRRVALASPARDRRWARRQVGFALAAAVLMAFALAATPPAREAIAGWLGLTHVTVKRVPVLPTPAGNLPPGRTQVSLAEARAAVGFAVRVPSGLVQAVFLVGGVTGGEVQFQVGGGVLLTETSGRFNEGFLGKVIGPGTEVNRVDVNGHPGAWIHGAPHAIAFIDSAGNFRTEDLRIVGDVLIWEEGGVVLRIEGASSQSAALVLAAGLR